MVYLLDTSACVDVLRGRADVIDRLRELSPDDCAVSAVSLFELLVGAGKSNKPAIEAAKVSRLIQTLVLVVFDAGAAGQAAMVRSDLERRGLRIGAYDMLIAGHALALGLTCVTANTSEFSRVPGLTIQDWRD